MQIAFFLCVVLNSVHVYGAFWRAAIIRDFRGVEGSALGLRCDEHVGFLGGERSVGWEEVVNPATSESAVTESLLETHLHRENVCCFV